MHLGCTYKGSIGSLTRLLQQHLCVIGSLTHDLINLRQQQQDSKMASTESSNAALRQVCMSGDAVFALLQLPNWLCLPACCSICIIGSFAHDLIDLIRQQPSSKTWKAARQGQDEVVRQQHLGTHR